MEYGDKSSSSAEEESETRQRKPTAKGLEYQLEIKVKSFISKKAELSKQMKTTLMLRGQCDNVSKWKQELSKAQIIQLDLADIHASIAHVGGDEGLQKVKDMWIQVASEWNNFQDDVKSEIRYVEQLYLEQTSKTSKSSRKTSSYTSSRTVRSHIKDKFELQKKEAALKVNLAFLNDEQRLDREKLRQEQEAENLKLKKELAQSQAQLNVCLETNALEASSADSILSALPKESHTESMKRYFDSLPFALPPSESKRSSVRSQRFIAPKFVAVSGAAADIVRTVHTTTQPFTTTTTSTPLISPAHYAVLNSQATVISQHDSIPMINAQHYPAQISQHFTTPVVSSHYHSTPVSSGPHVVMSSEITPINSSVPAISNNRYKPPLTGCDSTEARDRPGEMNPVASVFEPKTTTVLPAVCKYPMGMSPSADHEQVPEPLGLPSDGEWQRVAISLEKCMSKLVETNDKLVTSQTSVRPLEKSNTSPSTVKVIVPTFSGDPLQYPIWNSAFKALVDTRNWDADTKLNLLSQYVTGGPKQVVEHYLLIGTEDAYAKAKSVLHERYGNPNVVSSAFLSKLDKWPKINPRDSGGLREFSDFLDKVVAAREGIPSLAILDFAKENVKLIAKLPYHIEGKWRDVITTWRVENGESSYPSFVKFADFIREAADKANIPELEDLSKLNSRPKMVRSPGAQALVTSGSDGQHSKRELSDQVITSAKYHKKVSTERRFCLYCDKDHQLDDCRVFLEKPYAVRKNLFFKKKLCLGCALSNHQIKDCKNTPTCKHCGGAHLTCLHQEERANTNCTSGCNVKHQCGTHNSLIVPVWVRPCGDSSREILQYAVLDDQSNVSFISQSLCERLDLKGSATMLRLTTMQDSNVPVETNRISGVEVLDYNKVHIIKLPTLYSRENMPADPSQIAKPEVAGEWKHLERIAEKLVPYQPDAEISLLIGSNCPQAIRPREICAGGENEPYGQKTLLGWGVIGRVCKSQDETQRNVCNKISQMRSQFVVPTKAKEVLAPDILKVLESDFQETNTKSKPMSVEDRRFLQLLEDGICKLDNGHYQMPLPLRTDGISLPYNRPLAEKRWRQLQSRFKKNPKFLEDYKVFMKNVVHSCAEKVPQDRLNVQDGKVNYVPHTGVYHPRKPGQIRVVFDCSARYDGVSINDCLLQGPDLLNGLLGVLCRFREEKIAFMMDVKSMFHQFYVSEHHRDLLRFLWWEDGDQDKDVVEYRMKVHLFGAASSPGCANFGLKRAADDGEEEFGADAATLIRENFYVDDGLKSTPTAPEAIKLIESTKAMCAKAGLHLHKITSNSKEVLQAIPTEDRSKNTKELDLKVDPLPIEHVLGVVWCVEDDSFQFRIELKDRPFTRRGVLSTVSSIYDPNGYVAPVTLKGKQILQQMCRDKLDWDSPVPDSLRPSWEKWRTEITDLDKLKVPRCFKPDNFDTIKAVEVHHFSDASVEGYGQCSYLRLVNQENLAHCSIVVGKARVTPLKQSTIPRLELAAATTSARMSEFLRAELSYPKLDEYYWTDSQVVLGYVKNEARRFHVYVANRVQQIREMTDPNAWMYVDTSLNPADDASRGLTARRLLNGSRWLTGPEFLWEDGPFEVKQSEEHPLSEADIEVKKGKVLSTKAQDLPEHLDESRLNHISCWFKAKKVIALCLLLVAKFQRREIKNEDKKKTEVVKPLQHISMTPLLLQEAEKVIIRCVQSRYFQDELQALRSLSGCIRVSERSSAKEKKIALKKTSSIYKLDPFIDQDGLIRVGGRIGNADVPDEVRHPVLLPRKCHVATLLIRFHHVKVNHMGRTTTHNELRQRGYWILGGSSAVSNVISQCVTCRRQRRVLEQQKMSSLPKDRVEQASPFSYCAVDYFGPFIVKERRSEVKRYGVLFTCLGSRGVHLEIANSLDTSSFINALRRFLARRGPVRQIRCDQGTNFVGARNELKAGLTEMDGNRVSEYLLEQDCEWIPFQMNTPHSSHMGGSWERQIGTVRRALEPVLGNHARQLDDESLRTLMTEVECIVNSRPLTTDNLCDSDAPEPLTPNHLLTMKPKLLLPPPGEFQQADVYSRRRWRRVQYLVNEFWQRWRKEFLHTLQERHKWVNPKRDLGVGDVVIVKDGNAPRNRWPLARVVETLPSEDGRVRKVKLLMADGALDHRGKRVHPPTYLYRPVQKLVVLLPTKDCKDD